MNMKQLKTWMGKILNLQILLAEEHPQPGFTVIYVVRLMDLLLVWGPALVFAGLIAFYELYR